MSDTIVVRGAREHNLKNVDLELPRDQLDRLHRACRARASRRSRSTRSTPRASAATSSRCRRTRASSSARWTSPTSTSSRACRRRSRSTRSRRRATRARRSARSPRSTTTCACSTRASACRTARTAAGSITRQTPQQIVDRVLQLPEGTRFQVLAPVVRGRKGEYHALLDELAGQGFTRARVDGELVELAAPSCSSSATRSTRSRSSSTGSCAAPGIERRLTDSLETALKLAEGVAEVEIVHKDETRGARDPHVLRAPRVHALRAVVRRARAAQLLVQLALRRVPDVRRARHALRGRPRARDPRRRPLDRRGRDRAVVGLPGRVLQAGARPRSARSTASRPSTPWKKLKAAAKKVVLYGAGEQAGHGHATRTVTGASVRTRRKYEGVIPWVERRHTEVGVRPRARGDRGLHARRAVPGVRGRAAAARVARGHDRRQEHRRGRRAVDPRLRGVLPHGRAERARPHDRRARAQGGQRAAAVPARRRPRLPDAQPQRRARSRAARRSASGSRRRSAAGSSACCTCSTSRRSACTSATTSG